MGVPIGRIAASAAPEVTKMATLTIPMIRAMKPCIDPTAYAPEDWKGTVLDVLKMESVPDSHAVWLACQSGVLPERTRRLMACAFVRHTPIGDGRTVWNLLTDERSKNVVEVAERYANGQATEEEFSVAYCAAYYAAANAAANAAYYAAANAAANAAAYAAANAAANAAAYAAANAAANAAAETTADPTYAAAHAAGAAAHAAGAAAEAAQRQIAIRVIEENENGNN